jgi:peptide/nickel transport system substrate-binding protein
MEVGMNRRTLLQTAAAGIANLAAPRIGLAKSQQVLTFIPLADLAILDPIWTAARPTRNHGFCCSFAAPT